MTHGELRIMDDVRHSQHAVRQRPLFFIEGLAATGFVDTAKQDLADKVIVGSESTYAPLDDIVSRKLTPHLHFSDNFFCENNWANPCKPPYLYRQSFAVEGVLETLIRKQLRSPFVVLSCLEAMYWSLPKFMLVWQLLNALSHKLYLVIDKIFLSHALDKPRDTVLRRNPDYLQHKSLFESQLYKTLSQGVHRLFIKGSFPHMVTGACQGFILRLDVLQKNDNLVVVESDIFDIHAQAHTVYTPRLEEMSLQAATDKGKTVLHATASEIYTAWRDCSYRFFRVRHSLTRDIDQQLLNYVNYVKHMQPTVVTDTIQALFLLHRLQVALAIWIEHRQHLSSRVEAVVAMIAWVNNHFSQSARHILATMFYNDHRLTLAQQELVFNKADKELVK